ncbi:hypothetical protein SDC9_145347 [bioreactor metagenome]|uniref:Uncharacterized protein n=1 Tax=bioreactor metagenome TaxID=1076179 RepID=A0A645E867_9ZZZZ
MHPVNSNSTKMKHNGLLLIIILLLYLSACTQTDLNYKIVRTDIVMGKHKHFEWILQNDSVKVIEYPMSSDPDSIVCYKALTPGQTGKLQTILKGIDVDTMKESYVDSLTQGEGSSTYSITIGDKSKEIYVYYVDVPELIKIDKFLYDITADCK